MPATMPILQYRCDIPPWLGAETPNPVVNNAQVVSIVLRCIKALMLFMSNKLVKLFESCKQLFLT